MFACLFAMMLAAAPVAEFRFSPDFDLKKLGSQTTELAQKEDFCRVTAKKPEKFTGIRLPLDLTFQPDLALTFEYRVDAPENCKVAAVAVSVFTPGSNRSAGTMWLKPAKEWTKGKVPFAKLKTAPGTKLNAMTIYNRLANESPAAVTSLEIRNIRIDRAAEPAK